MHSAVLKFCANIKTEEAQNQVNLTKRIPKAKFYAYSFRAAMLELSGGGLCENVMKFTGYMFEK